MAVLMHLKFLQYARSHGEKESQIVILDEDGCVFSLGRIEEIMIEPTDGGTLKIQITIPKSESYRIAREAVESVWHGVKKDPPLTDIRR